MNQSRSKKPNGAIKPGGCQNKTLGVRQSRAQRVSDAPVEERAVRYPRCIEVHLQS